MGLERVICPLHELADPGAKGITRGGGDWPLRVAQGVPLEEPADLGSLTQ